MWPRMNLTATTQSIVFSQLQNMISNMRFEEPLIIQYKNQAIAVIRHIDSFSSKVKADLSVNTASNADDLINNLVTPFLKPASEVAQITIHFSAKSMQLETVFEHLPIDEEEEKDDANVDYNRYAPGGPGIKRR